MKSNAKSKTTILIILGTIFAFSILINAKFSYFGWNNSENLEVSIESNLKGADYWLLPGAQIFIDNSNPNYNWSKTANENDWCNGNGSLNNPYVIENVTIDATSSPTGCGIYINNSQTEYFTIRNVTVYNAGSGYYNAGIKLENTNNGTLKNNICSNNSGTGIYLENSNHNILSGNNVNNNNGYGIYLVGNNNTISGNTACNNTRDGIMLQGKLVRNPFWIPTYPEYLQVASYNNIISGNIVNNNENGIWVEDSHNNTISGNVANNNTWDGIMLWGSLLITFRTSYNNTIIGNTANYNSRGIVFVETIENTISENTVNNNEWYGILLAVGRNNNITGNTASYNTYGLYISQSRDNTIVGNAAYNNTNGIHLDESDYNIISGNIANNNTNGIHLDESDRNTITGNTLIGNTVCIVEVNCQENTFSNNGACTYGQGGNDIIPGYNLLFLLGILSVTVILTSKRLKKFLF
ncbi:hypothetical protein LCGC14_1213810 [marine sediment metagenome]|uniref:Right handed beta helix domain-containing protein n=1 Tax=marine sediment metagenome TaxID=412755 RepID=A0A0F9LDC5_9ZZZZ|nr:hypothetical protein [archaeon]